VVKSVDLLGEFNPGPLIFKSCYRSRSALSSMQVRRSLGVLL
jgi:hypothetical protein